ncbi:tRNA (guanine10-N2)-methyltransferase [Nematocida sp. AWRm77]|nr:tRNA (guanine10-N2)-methyltransferase [Nematocida sp. AWRm77]
MACTERESFSCLVVHPNIHTNFILAELHALLSMRGHTCSVDELKKKQIGPTQAYTSIITEVCMPKEDMDFLLSRAVLISKILVVPKDTQTLEELLSREDRQETYRVEVSSHKTKYTREEKLIQMKPLISRLQSKKVDLKNPDVVFEMLELPEKAVIGLLYRASRRKEILSLYSIKKREFIGTTAMDSEVAFIMANIAQVTHKDVVLDCFAGTGSLLLPCAILGATVVGTDINPKQFIGQKTPHKNPNIRTMQPGTDIYTNFFQFGVQSKAAMFGVANIFKGSFFKDSSMSVVIFDPPYGKRESTHSAQEAAHAEGSSKRVGFETVIPFVEEIFYQAEKFLQIGGRVCFFAPHHINRPLPESLGLSNRFLEVYRCTQVLDHVYSRTLCLYRKVK